MRLDKWLQLSRLIRRRALAKELCEAGRVRLNGRQAKAAADLRAGDTLTIEYGGGRTVELRVMSIPGRGTLSRAAAAQLYEYLSAAGPAPSRPAAPTDSPGDPPGVRPPHSDD